MFITFTHYPAIIMKKKVQTKNWKVTFLCGTDWLCDHFALKSTFQSSTFYAINHFELFYADLFLSLRRSLTERSFMSISLRFFKMRIFLEMKFIFHPLQFIFFYIFLLLVQLDGRKTCHHIEGLSHVWFFAEKKERKKEREKFSRSWDGNGKKWVREKYMETFR